MTKSAPLPVTYGRHYQEKPQITHSDGSKSWITRGANFVIALTEAQSGTVLTRDGNPDEYMVLLPPGTSATARTVTEQTVIRGNSLTILPPGDSTITIDAPALVLSIFSSRAEDLTALAGNASIYAAGTSAVLPLVNWPDPVGGFKIRSYDLSGIGDPDGELIQPRIFRSTNLMVNAFLPFQAKRPTDELRPHWHDDFEQASVALSGRWIHSTRTPWGVDLAGWKPDEHMEIDSPSVTVIPETLIHTSRNISEGEAWLIDIFSPPRVDFSQAGIVLNAADYPMPVSGSVEERDVPAAWRNNG